MNYKSTCWYALSLQDELFNHIGARSIPIYFRYQQKSNNGVFAVNINARIGMFAQIDWCLYIFAYCELHNLRPFIILSSPFYTRPHEHDWLSYFFYQKALHIDDQDKIENNDITISKVDSIEQLGLPFRRLTKLSIESGRRLIDKYLVLKMT